MIAMIFEVRLKPAHVQSYLDAAARLREHVCRIDGFITIERFESLYEPGKILSLGFFESEAAVAAWRKLPEHRQAQAVGRARYFEDYRLRIAQVSRDYGMRTRDQAPVDSRLVHG